MIKAFVYPFILTGAFLVFCSTIYISILKNFILSKKNELFYRENYPKLYFLFFMVYNFIALAFIIFDDFHFYLRHYAAPIMIYVELIVVLGSKSFFDSFFKDQSQKIAYLSVLILLILISYIISKYQSNRIHTNKEYEMWANKTTDYLKTDTIKYLGKAGDYYLFTTLNNNKIIIKKTDEAKTLELITIKN